MNNEQILVKLKEFKKGAYANLVKTKTYKNGVLKITYMVIKLGIDYKKLKVNLNKVCGELPYGEWLNDFDNFVISHNDKLQLRLYPSLLEKHKPKSVYYYNGNEITKEEAIAIEGEKALKSKESNIINIKFEDIVSIKQGDTLLA